MFINLMDDFLHEWLPVQSPLLKTPVFVSISEGWSPKDCVWVEQSGWDGAPQHPFHSLLGVPLGSLEAGKPDIAFPSLPLSQGLDVTWVWLTRWPRGRQAQQR